MAANLNELNLANLGLLDDGVVVRQVMLLIQNAVADIKSRPGERRARKVQIQLELTPKTVREQDEDGKRVFTLLTGVALKVGLDVKLPNRRTLEYDLGVSTNSDRLLFNENSPFDHRQRTLFDAEPADDDQ